MSLFDGEPLTIEECQLAVIKNLPGVSIRKVSRTGKVYTVRHKPWWMLLGKGPSGLTCGDCVHLIARRYGKTYLKCGRQIITAGPGTDIRKKDPACRLFREAL